MESPAARPLDADRAVAAPEAHEGAGGAAPAAGFFILSDEQANTYVVLSNGAGTFGPLTLLASLTSTNYGSGVGDFDGDENLDFITGNNRGAGSAILPRLFRGHGDGTFSAPELLPTTCPGAGALQGGAVADFDLDGGLDFVADARSTTVGFYWGHGDGTFATETRTGFPGTGRHVEAGDFDEDGFPDLLRSTTSDGLIRLYVSRGDRSFGAAVTVGDAGSAPYGLAAGDYDRDGHLDVLATEGPSGDVYVIRGRGAVAFDAPVLRPELDAAEYNALDTFDYDGDGILDVVACTYTGRRVLFSRGVGNGTFSPLSTLTGQPAIRALGIAAPPAQPLVDVEIAPQHVVASLGVAVDFNAVGSQALAGDAYAWDLGDGATASVKDPLPHAYAREGIYIVRLVHTTAGGVRSVRATRATVRGNAPTASHGGPYVLGEAAASQALWTATLDGSASSDDFGITSYSWDFGDGLKGAGAIVQHTWVGPGPWTVTLTVADAAGLQGSAQTTVTFTPGAPPVAAITGPSVLNETAASRGTWRGTYSAASSTDDFAIWKYEWDFGNAKTATGVQGAAAYTAAGNYTVTLKVYDHAGQVSTTTLVVQVTGGALPQAVILGPTLLDESAATAGLWASTWDGRQSTDDTGIYAYAWVFGDGATATAAQATHNYAAAGDYTVKLTVTDNGKQTSTAQQVVHVTPNNPPVARPTATPSIVEEEEPVDLDGSASTDDFGIYRYRWQFPLLNFNFHGKIIDQSQWGIPTDGIFQDGRLVITGSGSFGPRYFQSIGTLVRRGAAFQARVDTSTGTSRAIVGLRNLTFTSTAFSQITHGVYFNDGTVQIVEANSTRASPGPYSKGTAYDIRIETRLPTGAGYFWRPSGSGQAFTLLFDSTGQSLAEMSFAGIVSTGVFGFDEVQVDKAFQDGQQLTRSVHPGGTITLEVLDDALQMHSATVSVATGRNAPPMAVLESPDSGEVGSELLFSSAGSSDDHGIASSTFDFGDGAGMSVRGTGGVSHFYATGGDYNVTLTVYDHAGQPGVATKRVTIGGEGLVKAVPWRFIGAVEIPHETWTGREVVLQAVVARAALPVSYTWDFGDGSSPVTGTATTRDAAYAIEARHVYEGSTGTPFAAKVSIVAGDGSRAADTFPIIIRDRNLEVEMNAAIDDGLWYLHKTQVRSDIDPSTRAGRWTFGSYVAGPTASAVQAFAINGHREWDDASRDPYVETVSRGINHLWTLLRHVNMSPQPHGDPDGDGNGIGIEIAAGSAPYQLGQVMDAVIAAGRETHISKSGPINIKGRPYGDLIQDMVDMYSWGQYDDATVGGGWRYNWNTAPDNSAAQWGAIGLIPAERIFGISAPAWVKARNLVWLKYSSTATYGFGYTSSTSVVDRGQANAPSGLVQLDWLEVPTSDILWRQADDHLGREWSRIASGFNLYTYFAIAKSMRLAQPPVFRLSSTGKDWFLDPVDGLARLLVNRQDPATKSWRDLRWLSAESARQYATAWSVIILSGTLFELRPIAVIHLRPNPGAVGQEVSFDASASYHPDPTFRIVDYRWDFDASDGINFDAPDAVGPLASHAFPALRDYTVTVRVEDNSTPARFGTGTVQVRITVPPHPPTAVAGGPYVAATGEDIQLDGTGSFDIDQPDGDSIRAWDWEVDFEQPLDFSDGVSGPTARIAQGFASPGTFGIGLRVTDRTSQIFPQAGSPDLTNDDFTNVIVHAKLIDDLIVRPKDHKVQLTWTHRGGRQPWHVQVWRSEQGPNRGFVEVGATQSTYAVFIDEPVELGKRYYYRLLVFAVPPDGQSLGQPIGASGAVGVTSSPRVRDPNRAPRFLTEPTLEAIRGQPYTYDADAEDPEGDDLTYSLAAGPVGMTIDSTSGVVSFTPVAAQLGAHEVFIEAADGDGGVGSQFFEVVVSQAPTRPPLAEANGPHAALRGEEIRFSSAGSSDPDGDPLSFTWSFGDGNVSSEANPRHVYSASGNYVATVIVSDGRGGTASDNTQVIIDEPNRAPRAEVVTGPRFGVRQGQALTLDASASEDLDGDALTFSWSWGDSTASGAGVRATHTYAREGIFLASLRADDGRGGVGVYEISIDVGAGNRAPVVEALIDVAGRNPGDEWTFDGSRTQDPDGDPILLNWDFGDASKTTGLVVTHTFQRPGDFTVVLTARDDQGGSTSATIPVHVNAPPVFVSTPPTEALEDALYTYVFQATDANGEPLVYSLTSGPQGMTFDGAGRRLSWTPAQSDVGPHSVALRVDDPSGGSAGQAFTLIVIDVNDDPQILSSPPLRAAVGSVYAYSAQALDPEGEALGFALTSGPATMAIDPDTGRIAWTPLVTDVGTYPVLLQVRDPRGGTASQAWTLQVRPENRPPEVTSLAPTSAQEDAPYAYQLEATDIDGDSLFHHLREAPAGMTIGAGTGLVQWAPVAADIGPHAVAIEVSDVLGAAVVQSYTLTVAPVNDSPEFTTTSPPQAAEPGILYRYQPGVTDEEGQALTFSLRQSPSGMTVNPVTGEIRWTPAAGQIGAFTVILRVVDASGGSAEQVFTITVANLPHPPVVTSIPDQVRPEPAPFTSVRLDDFVSDIDHPDSALTWRATGQSALTVVIDASRVARITYAPGSRASEKITFTATDPEGLSGSASARFTVAAPVDDHEPPVLAISLTQDTLAVGELLRVRILAQDDHGIASVSASANGLPLVVTDLGGGVYEALFQPGAPGVYTIEARALDVGGNSFADQAEIFAFDPALPGQVDVEITAPLDSGEVRSATAIQGTAAGEGFAYYWLDYAPVGTLDFVRFAEGSSPVSGDVLGTLDPTSLSNGYYTVRLTARSLGGEQARTDITVSVEGPKVGPFTLAFVDKKLLVGDSPLTVTRSYDSRDKRKGDFGVGWRLDMASARLEENRSPSTGWQQTRSRGLIPSFAVFETVSHTVRVTLSDDEKYEFRPRPSPSVQAFAPIELLDGMSYSPLGGGGAKLTAPSAPFFLIGAEGPAEIFDAEFEPYNPSRFVFETPRGYRYELEEVKAASLRHEVTSITDPSGIKVRITPQGLLRSDGLSVLFQRDGEGRITRVTDPDGKVVVYEYSLRGDLAAVTDELGNRTEMTYDRSHNLIELRDPLGNRAIRSEYDDAGRVIATTDALGNRIEFTHDVDGREEIVRDRLGNVRKYTYDTDGRILVDERSVTIAGQVKLARTINAYDTAGNLVSQTDAEGRTTTWSYDARGNKLGETRPGGVTTKWTYNARNQILTETDPEGTTTTHTRSDKGLLLRLVKTDRTGAILSRTEYAYDARGLNIEQRVTLDGAEIAITRLEYDRLGNQSALIDPLGNRIEYEYDRNGRRTLERKSRRLPDGSRETSVSRFEYDVKGRLTKQSDPLAGVTTLEYNANDKRTAVTDANSHTTRYEYDTRGNLIRTIHPDGTTQSATFDAESRKSSETDRAGNLTRFEHDELGRQVAVSFPDDTPGNLADNPTRRTTYDRIGRIVAESDERGNTTTYTHTDAAAGAPATQTVRDALGRITIHELDRNGRVLRRVDALGHETRSLYDGMGRLVRTTFHDGTFAAVELDLGGRKTTEIDAAGRRREFYYDLAGRLLEVVGALDFGMQYGHDEAGNLVSQTDALGRTTHFEYDALGRKTARILPLGQRETFEYDAKGNLVSRIDFNGAETAYEYDSMDRLVSESYPDGSRIAFTYTAMGQRATLVDARGTTRWQYDTRSHLVRTTEPDGAVISHAFDAAGNRTTTTTAAGVTRHVYDALNRLLTVTDPDGAIAQYTYDAAGNRATVGYSTGAITRYTHDALNRLTRLVNEAPGGAVQSSYLYTLLADGQRTRVVETGAAAPSRTVDYQYDELGRLALERIDAADTDGDIEVSYQYDLAGNRIERRTVAGRTTTTNSYAYDDNDRLRQERETVTVASVERRGQEPLLAALAEPRAFSHRAYLTVMGVIGSSAIVALGWLIWQLASSRRSLRRWPRLVLRSARGFSVAALVVLFILGPEKLHALSVGSSLYCQVGAAAIGQAAPRTTYDYDQNGNLIALAGPSRNETYAYDLRNRLVSSDRDLPAGQESVTYAYDADDIRVEKSVNGVVTSYLVDHSLPFASVALETTSGAQVSYVHGDDLISMKRPAAEGGKRFYHFDGAHSTRQLTSASGLVTDTYAFDAFGSLLDSTGSTRNDFRYTGEQYDPNTGFYYLRARYYAPEQGRFLSQDPYEGRAVDPVSLHRYLYADSDPVNKRDPSGRFTLISVAISVSIVGILSSIAGTLLTGKLTDGLRIGFYSALSAAGLMLAAVTGTLPIAIALGVIQGVLQMVIDGLDPSTENKTHALLAFMKGFSSGVFSALGTAIGIAPGVVAGALTIIQEIVDAIATGEADLGIILTKVIVAAAAAQLGAFAASGQFTEAVGEMVSTLIGLNASLILNDLLGLRKALGG